MPEAAQLIGIGFTLFGAGFAIYMGALGWAKVKKTEREEDRARPALSNDVVASLDARLTHIEHVVESTAVEIERIAEAQRYATKLLADKDADKPSLTR
jgi:hypothetical protein